MFWSVRKPAIQINLKRQKQKMGMKPILYSEIRRRDDTF